MDNAAQIDLHTASIVLKNKIIQSHYFNMSLTFSVLPQRFAGKHASQPRVCSHASCFTRDCRPTILRPTLRWTDFMIYR